VFDRIGRDHDVSALVRNDGSFTIDYWRSWNEGEVA